MRKCLLSFILLLLSSLTFAQKISISTNVLGYAALGTLNADVSYSVS